MGPKIMIFDIESTPLEAYAWGPKWDTSLIEVTEQSRILSYSAKWLDGKHITKGWPDYKGYKKGVLDDEAITKDIWKLFNESDIIVAQNGKDFDIRVCNARFIKHGLTPPKPYKVVDPKREAKKYLRLPSNSLDDICDYFGIGRKMEHEGFPLWKKCMAGDKKAWDRMLKYNKHDVELTEELYLKLRPWMSNHPNYGIYIKSEDLCCPVCGSTRLSWEGWHRTKTARYHSASCKNCGSWFRDTKNVQGLKPLIGI
jgi:DNA polymerase III epsilon subunit-like protein